MATLSGPFTTDQEKLKERSKNRERAEMQRNMTGEIAGNMINQIMPKTKKRHQA